MIQLLRNKNAGSRRLNSKRDPCTSRFLLADVPQRGVGQGRASAKIKLLLQATVCLSAITAAGPHLANAQNGPFLYVPSANDNTVSVIDTPTNASVPPPIVTDVQPVVATVRGDQSFVYVTNMASNTVSVINTATNAVVATVNVGSAPAGAAVTPNGTRSTLAIWLTTQFL
jgi:YVTN family beta-propeller protein